MESSGERGDGNPARRRFLSRLLIAVGGFLSACFGAGAFRYLTGGVKSASESRWSATIRVADLEPEEPVDVQYVQLTADAWATIRRRKSAWVVRGADGTITVFDPHCTHLGCPYDWDAAKRVFRCPCHGGVFDLQGRVLSGPPPRPLDRLEYRIQAGRLLLPGALPRKRT